jgi:hypothetical protein
LIFIERGVILMGNSGPLNLKVKRSRNLYKSEKSSFRKTAEIVILAVVVVGLGFVGYTIMDTVSSMQCLDCESHRFSCSCETLPPHDTTPHETNYTDTPFDEPPNTDDVTGDTSSQEEGEPTPPDNTPLSNTAVYAPSNVLANHAALSVFIDGAKDAGFDTVVVEMKDETGRLLYQSGISIGSPPTLLADNRNVVTGTLSAEAIAAAIKERGLNPVARINTLRDHIAPRNISNTGYAGWLDGRPDAGGRPWVSPFRQETHTYIAALVGELHNAGFDEIIFAGTVFPKASFSGLDLSILPSYVTNLQTRYNGLVEFVEAVATANTDATILLEMGIACLAGDLPTGTAEIMRGLRGNAGRLPPNVTGVVPIFSRNDFNVFSGELVELESRVTTLLNTVTAALHGGEIKIVPLLDVSDLSDSDRDTITAAFIQNGFEDFVLRN